MARIGQLQPMERVMGPRGPFEDADMCQFMQPSEVGRCPMQPVGPLATLAIAVAWVFIQSTGALAQTRPELRNEKITFDYYEPRNPKLLPLYEKLQKRQALENLSGFLAPVKWPRKLRMILKECPALGTPQPEVFYQKVEYSLNICYQLFDTLEKLRPPRAFATRQEVIVGGLVGVVLHEAAHAVFDMLKISRLGSEEDAADQISTYIGLQFGDEVARTVIKGTYFVWKKFDDEITSKNRQYDF